MSYAWNAAVSWPSTNQSAVRCAMPLDHSELGKALALLGIGMTSFLLVFLCFHAFCIYFCYCLVPSKDLQILKTRSKRKKQLRHISRMKKTASQLDIEALPGKIVHM